MSKPRKCFWCGNTEFGYVAKRSDDVKVVSCLKCGLMQVAESPPDLEQYYTQEYYSPDHKIEGIGYEEYYALTTPLFLLWQSALLDAVTSKNRTHNLLDVGCATGNLMDIIEQYHPNFEVSGIDISDYAVAYCKKKMLQVEKVYIQNYNSKGFDIILSLETLEHLDDLKSFAEGVRRNTKKDGAFMFYVPSVSRSELEDISKPDIRLQTNLEHLIYFTPDFFETEFAKYFSQKIYISEVVTSFGRSIIGLVTNDEEMGSKFGKVFQILGAAKADLGNEDDRFLKSLVILSAKFYDPSTTSRIMSQYESRQSVKEDDLSFVRAVNEYHQGNIASSITDILAYYNENPSDEIALKILLANEASYNKTLIDRDTRVSGIMRNVQKENLLLKDRLNKQIKEKLIQKAKQAKKIIKRIST